MIEGWTKNLALLFNNALATALWKVLDIVLLVGLPWLAIHLWNARFSPQGLEWLGAGWVLAAAVGADPVSGSMRGWRSRTFRLWIARSRRLDCRCLSALLYRSWFKHRVLKQVSWKGQDVPVGRVRRSEVRIESQEGANPDGWHYLSLNLA